MVEAVTPLEQFAIAVLRESRDIEPGDVDGGFIQDKAEELGLLVKVRVTESCGELCHCAEYDDFPQDCLCYSVEVKKAMSE